eukprot:scaffold602_cov298-Pinguiococcus_pyrenoidosus.AAC.51
MYSSAGFWMVTAVCEEASEMRSSAVPAPLTPRKVRTLTLKVYSTLGCTRSNSSSTMLRSF